MMQFRTLNPLLLFTALFFNLPVSADNHYVATTGVNSGTCASAAAPCLTLQYSLNQMAAGDVLNIANGTYSGNGNHLDTYNNSNFIPNGTIAAYTTLRAATTGGVTIGGAFNLSTSSAYLQFEGLRFTNTGSGKSVRGQHIKIFRSAFVGGPATNNNVNFGIGTNDVTPGAQHILLEDVWAYGPGGRYSILIYNSENVVVRRAVVRHDAGWTPDGSNPESGVVIYNSRNVALQNVIVLDSIGISFDHPNSQGFTAMYNVSNGSGGTVHENTKIVGSMVLNNQVQTGIAWDDYDPINNARLEHSVIFNSGNSITSNGQNKHVTIANVTLYGGTGKGISLYGANSSYNISNSIICGKLSTPTIAGGALDSNAAGQVRTDLLCFNNSGSNGCNITHIDPITNGLVHLPQTESGSYLRNNQIGAEIFFRIGVSGTLYGESGYDTVGTESLWPWPNQSVIYTDMCAVRASAMCSAADLTNYVWNLTGNSIFASGFEAIQ